MRICSAFISIAFCAGVSGIFVPDNARGTDAVTPPTRLSVAKAAPCSTAISMYESLSADTTVPDSIRSRAFGLRADYAFALREYETALDNYKKASALDKKNTRYSYRSGLSYLANGDTVDAIKTFTQIADKNEPVLSNEARVMLGHAAYTRGDYKGAMDFYRQTGKFSATNSWSINACLGKLMCARALGLADSAALYEKQLSPYAKTLLEKESFAKIPGGAVINKSDTGAVTAKPAAIDTGKKPVLAGPTDSNSNLFTLQVGAFASETAALAMKKKLAKTLKDVRCVTAIISARTFYRVWVGNFATREAAEKFGQEEIMDRGLVYRVVAK